MTMQVAKWQLTVRAAPGPAETTNSSPAARRFHRQQLDQQIARERTQAYNRWLLLGGAANR